MRMIFSDYVFHTSKISSSKKIIHLSDIHYYPGYDVKRLELIVQTIREKKPDYICITGDLIDTSYSLDETYDLKVFRAFLADLGKCAKVFISIGNHEIQILNPFTKEKYESVLTSFLHIDNVFVLDNTYCEEEGITFIGYNPPITYYQTKEKKIDILINDLKQLQFPTNQYTVLLIHTPIGLLQDETIEKIPLLLKCDLILAGHTHGGMMPTRFPGNFGLISPFKKLFPSNVRGKIIKKDTTLLICSGVVRLSKVSHLEKFNNLYAIHMNSIIIQKNGL